MNTLQKDIVFWTFCQTLQSTQRNMHTWIQMDIQETALIIQNHWEVTAHQHIYIREVKA